ncbi:hypothetical protein [Caulobacter sp. CCH9-E1]|uniref:hypothetical protein n=1 Tax=Caulobacter sp. CCH9-E1 TaxID=1768768 RepID=UPI000AE4C853|nr:hypothetical protein [Caulobacter sp. CCH9-E1]
MSKFVPINVGFKIFFGISEKETIYSYIGSENFQNIIGPARRSTQFFVSAAALYIIVFPALYALFAGAFLIRGLSAFTLVAFLSTVGLFLVWVMGREVSRSDSEIIGMSPRNYYQQINELFEFKNFILSNDIKIYCKRRLYSASSDVVVVDPQLLTEDHGIVWIFGRERGFVVPKNIHRPVIMGDLMVDVSEISGLMPGSFSKTLSFAANSLRDVPNMSVEELDRLEHALEFAGEYSDSLAWCFKVLKAYSEIPRGETFATALKALSAKKLVSDEQRERARKLIGGRYEPFNDTLGRAAKRLNLK